MGQTIRRSLAILAAVAACAGCSSTDGNQSALPTVPTPGSQVSTDTPAEGEPTAVQQQHLLGIVAADVLGYVQLYPFKTEKLPLTVLDDGVRANGKFTPSTLPHPSVQIFGSVEENSFCVEVSAPGIGEAEGTTVVESRYSSLLPWDEPPFGPCPAEMRELPVIEYAPGVPLGLYLPANLEAEAGVCFREEQYNLSTWDPALEDVWNVVDCAENHPFEIVAADYPPAEWAEYPDAEQPTLVAHACAVALATYEPKLPGRLELYEYWRPFESTPYTQDRYICVGSYI